MIICGVFTWTFLSSSPTQTLCFLSSYDSGLTWYVYVLMSLSPWLEKSGQGIWISAWLGHLGPRLWMQIYQHPTTKKLSKRLATFPRGIHSQTLMQSFKNWERALKMNHKAERTKNSGPTWDVYRRPQTTGCWEPHPRSGACSQGV